MKTVTEVKTKMNTTKKEVVDLTSDDAVQQQHPVSFFLNSYESQTFFTL